MRTFTECTDVYFSSLSDEEINYYLNTYKYDDKAGAYGIQDWIGMIGVSRIEGDYYNVMGLPVARMHREIEKIIRG
jgi:septum formation protein